MPKREELNSEQYIARGGSCCPVCHAQEFGHTTLVREKLEAPGDYAIQLVKCMACESTWNDLFKLSGFEICTYGDRSMTAAELKKIYGEETGGHPTQTYAAWQTVVASGQSDQGYWEWVEAVLAQESLQVHIRGKPYAASLEAIWSGTADNSPPTCTVVILSQMEPGEVDDEVGPMYKVRLPDGSVEEAFHSELTLT